MRNLETILIESIKKLHHYIVFTINSQIEKTENSKVAKEFTENAGDVLYEIDIKAEKIILDFFTNESFELPIDLVMEGVGIKSFGKKDGNKVTIIIDPIDGTREIMYDKRSAWVLTGIAFTKSPSLNDISISIQTEIPNSKQYYYSQIIAEKGRGVYEEIYDIKSEKIVYNKKYLSTSKSTTLTNGFICFPNPFPGNKIEIAKRYEDFCKAFYQNTKLNEASIFSDEYISTGGQIYLLATGRYRLVVDIRDKVQKIKNSLCCHPYDLCTYLIVIEAGGCVTNVGGLKLSYPLDTTTNCNWVGYCNSDFKKKYEEVLLKIINK